MIRDAGEQSTPIAALVVKEECQLRTLDKEQRWACTDGVWILRTTRQWIHRDLDILKPLFDTMREEGSDFLTKKLAVSRGNTADVRRYRRLGKGTQESREGDRRRSGIGGGIQGSFAVAVRFSDTEESRVAS